VVFKKSGGCIGAMIGMIMPFTGMAFLSMAPIVMFYNHIKVNPFKDINDYLVIIFLGFCLSVVYHAALGFFAGKLGYFFFWVVVRFFKREKIPLQITREQIPLQITREQLFIYLSIGGVIIALFICYLIIFIGGGIKGIYGY
jgi:hypothetical protein